MSESKNLEFMLLKTEDINYQIFSEPYYAGIQKKYWQYFENMRFERIKALREMTGVGMSKRMVSRGLDELFKERKKHNGRQIYLHYIKKFVDAVGHADEEKVSEMYEDIVSEGLYGLRGEAEWVDELVKLNEITNVAYPEKLFVLMQKAYFNCISSRNFENFARIAKAGICKPLEQVIQAGYRLFARQCAFEEMKLLKRVTGCDICSYTARFINQQYIEHLKEDRIEFVKKLWDASKVNPSPETRRFFLEIFLG